MDRLVYNKPLGDKNMLRGGPRDMQYRQQLIQQDQAIRTVVKEELAVSGPTMVGGKESTPSQTTVDLSQYLTLEEVRIKLEQATDFVRNEERNRYESGLKNLNDQLKEARRKASLSDENLINAKAEIRKLQTQLLESPTSTNDLEKIQLLNEELIVFKLRVLELEQVLKIKEESGNEIKDLREKLDKLYCKISDGSISPLVGSKMDKPALEGTIFIDPIDGPKDLNLESHIKIEESSSIKTNRDVSSDLAKLRSLLKL